MVATFTKDNLRDDEEYITMFGIMTCDDNKFDEEKHPRKKDGKFAKTKGSKETKTEKSNASEVEINKKAEYSFSNKNSNKGQERKQNETKIDNTENEEPEEEPVINKIKNMSPACKKCDDICKASKIKHREVRKLKQQLSMDEIVKKIGGADKTPGSCASIALTYVANKCGLDVNDFRGGKSRDIFSDDDFILDIAHINGHKNYTIRNSREIETAKGIIDKLENNKEYLCGFGMHMSIVRKIDNDIQYLELQDEKSGNGWKSFYEWDNTKYNDIDEVLKKRFCAKEDRIKKGNSINTLAVAIEVDSFKNNLEFQHLLGYINTAKEKQKKQETLFHTSNKIDYNNIPLMGIEFI